MMYSHETFAYKMKVLTEVIDNGGDIVARKMAVLAAYRILNYMDSVWDKIPIGDRSKAGFYWKSFVLPAARELGLSLDGNEQIKYRTDENLRKVYSEPMK